MRSTPARDGVVLRLEQERGVALVTVAGELDLLGKAAFDARVGQALAAQAATAGPVLVDLCACSFLDSTGLGGLVRGLRGASRQGSAFAVCCVPGGAAAQVLALALPGILAVHPDRATALAVLGSAG